MPYNKNLKQTLDDYTKVIELDPYYGLNYLNRAVLYLRNQDYLNSINDLNMALRYGISSEDIATYKEKIFNEDSIAQNIFAIFESVHQILDELKVSKDSKDKAQDKSKDSVNYLSHTTKLSVFTKFLVPIHNDTEPELGKLRMYHIAYANDPTEGMVLLDHLGIAPEQIEDSADIPYVMVASFCGGQTPEALDRLPIWSMYGDNAQGIALLFQTKDLAYKGPGHVGYSEQTQGISNFQPATFKQSGDNSLENNEVSSVLQSKKSIKKEIPPQILYKVHYVQKPENTKANDKKPIDKMIENIEKGLANITKDPKYNLDIYHKCLELLSGIRYLIKDKSYAHEQEYRFVCFAGTEHIPEILQSEQLQDIETKSVPYIYIETDKLNKLCAVLTAPKASKAERLYINYLLQLYKKGNKFPKLEEPAIYKSSIPYR